MKCHDLKVSSNYMAGAFTIALIAMVLNIETSLSRFTGRVITVPVWRS
jgi:hypothetical protein